MNLQLINSSSLDSQQAPGALLSLPSRPGIESMWNHAWLLHVCWGLNRGLRHLSSTDNPLGEVFILVHNFRELCPWSAGFVLWRVYWGSWLHHGNHEANKKRPGPTNSFQDEYSKTSNFLGPISVPLCTIIHRLPKPLARQPLGHNGGFKTQQCLGIHLPQKKL